jgi:MFS family permease
VAGTFAALGLRHFRVIWASAFFSFVAFFMSTVVQSVVAFDLTHRNGAVGSVVAGQGLAMLLLGPLGGAFADRVRKRRLIAAAQSATLAVFLLLALALARDAMRVEYLTLGSFVMGATFAFIGPARQALVVDLVGTERRGNALALTQIGHSASRVLGPALAGLLLGWSFAGPTGAYLGMAALYALSAASLALLPPSVVRADAREQHVLADVAAGLRYVGGHPRLRLLIAFFVSVIMLSYPYVTVLPGLLEHQLGLDARALSTLLGVSAAGAVGGSLASARFADSRHATRIYVGAAMFYGVSLFGLALAPSYGAALASMVGIGVGSGAFQSLNGAVIVREAEPALFGRVSSLTTMAFAGFGLMGLPAGLLADAIGERGALVAMACAVLGVTLALGSRLLAGARSVVETADARARDTGARGGV